MLFCDTKESIQHLLFKYPLAKLIWHVIHMMFGLEPPKNTTNLFGNWLKGILNKDLFQIRVGVCAVIWTICITRNDFIFNKPNTPFAGSLCGYPLDPYVVLTPTRGAAGGDGF
jgi:hypothetical protein